MIDSSFRVMRLLCVCVLCALVSRGDGMATGEFAQTEGRTVHVDEGVSPNPDPMKQQVVQPAAGSPLNVKVQVNDALSRRPLSQAEVDVYVNYTRTSTALTGEDGGVLLHVPLHAGLPVTFVASKDGFISTALPYKTNRTPIFSSVSVSLLAPTQGNIWLFEDSVLIFSKTSDASLQPVVTFPQSLLNLTHSGNVTSIRTFLTFPLQQNGLMNPPGVVRTQSGLVGVELRPVASVSVQLFSGDSELHVSGPIQIRLRVPSSSGLHSSDVVPAWFFNRTTGAWMRKGLGKVTSVEGKLMWTFTAPHLGHWVAAAASSSTRGFSGPVDFFLHHSSVVTALCGGTLIMAVCLLAGLLCYCRRSSSENNSEKLLPVMRRDQTTSTCDEVFEISSGSVSHPKQSSTERADDRQSSGFLSLQHGGLRADPDPDPDPGAVAVLLELDEPGLNPDLTASGQIRVPATLSDSLFFFNQHVAILHAPAFLHVEDQPEQVHRSRSSTLPRVGASAGAAAETLTENGFTQTKGPCDQQSQAAEAEPPGAPERAQAASSRTCRGPFSLPESLSVPGTLNRIGHNRHASAGASKVPSPQPPRAWFVSLEGKPAAEIQHPRRRRPVESRETSLDSGVDMSELNQTSGRRTVTLERNATFVKSKQDAPQ